MRENLEEKTRKRIIVLGLGRELGKVWDNPSKFVKEKDAKIIYCRAINSFNKIISEKMPVKVYYTGKIRQYYDSVEMTYGMTINNPKKIRRYLKSKGIKKIIRIKVD